jgi:hypothetical protein
MTTTEARSSELTGSIFRLADTQVWAALEAVEDGLMPLTTLVDGENTAIFFTAGQVPLNDLQKANTLYFRLAELADELPVGVGLIINPDTDCLHISAKERIFLVEAGRPFPEGTPVRLGSEPDVAMELAPAWASRTGNQHDLIRVWPAWHQLVDASLKMLLAYECEPGSDDAVNELLSDALDESDVAEPVIIMNITDVPAEAREWLFANVAPIESARQSVGS